MPKIKDGYTAQNSTHWKTSDILRVIAKAARQAKVPSSAPIRAAIDYGPAVAIESMPAVPGQIGLSITLPKRGASVVAPLMALAAAAIESETPFLPLPNLAEFANTVAAYLARGNPLRSSFNLATTDRLRTVMHAAGSKTIPSWAEGLLIRRYAEPKKKEKTRLEKAEEAADRAEDRAAHYKALFKRAERAAKKHRKRANLMRSRRDAGGSSASAP
jgi:hypothetical protein